MASLQSTQDLVSRVEHLMVLGVLTQSQHFELWILATLSLERINRGGND